MPLVEGQRLHWNGDFALSEAVVGWLIAAPAEAGAALADALARYLRGDWGDGTNEAEREKNERALLPDTPYHAEGTWGRYLIGAGVALGIGKDSRGDDTQVRIERRITEDEPLPSGHIMPGVWG